MGRQPIAKVRQASIGVNQLTGAIRLSVPQGTRLVDAISALSKVDLAPVLAKLPKQRGCEACHSGCPFEIREEFDPIINVRLGR